VWPEARYHPCILAFHPLRRSFFVSKQVAILVTKDRGWSQTWRDWWWVSKVSSGSHIYESLFTALSGYAYAHVCFRRITDSGPIWCWFLTHTLLYRAHLQKYFQCVLFLIRLYKHKSCLCDMINRYDAWWVTGVQAQVLDCSKVLPSYQPGMTTRRQGFTKLVKLAAL
jgi:hypothetical protein